MHIRELKPCSLEKTQTDVTTIFTYLRVVTGIREQIVLCEIQVEFRA